MKKNIEIAPSLLSADFTRLADDIKLIEDAGVDRIHLDIMDGHFVPNITFGPPLVSSIRKVTTLPLESHLMITEPEKYIIPFRNAGSDTIIVHYETLRDIKSIIGNIKQSGAKVGISINPATPWEGIRNVLSEIDLVLVMSVNPGFGGQAFMPEVLPKIVSLSNYIQTQNLNIDIEIDGGINEKTVVEAAQAGAHVIVAGASIFGAPDVGAMIGRIRKLAEKA